ncbi:MAG: DNA polymerase IV [Tissierellia bacterium]|nr:DNA polymerase IV [Tissierellia bacterium]
MDWEALNIIHLDMDAFYAAVEELDNPSLKGKPVIVGGTSKRGIVTTANYEARKYGIHSAMPLFQARQRCPHGIYLPTRRDRYSEVSKEVFNILYEITDLVEKLSIDEAFLDVSDVDQTPLEIVNYIRKKVKDEIGLTMSFGISYNKFLAKLASDWEKPEGLTIITEDMVPEILLPLPVRKVYGIGRKSEKKFNNIGVFTVSDMMNLSEEFLVKFLGKMGKEVYERIRGIDNRVVDPHRERKSIGTERTFKMIRDKKILRNLLKSYSNEVSEDMKVRGIVGKTINVKIKYEDFSSHTRSFTMENYTNSPSIIYDIAVELLEDLPLEQHVRLIGLSMSNLDEDLYTQMTFL